MPDAIHPASLLEQLGSWAALINLPLELMGIIRRTAEGKPEVNPDKLKEYIPKWAKTHVDEAMFAHLIAQLSPGDQRAILEWLLPALTEHQQADFIKTVATMSLGKDDAETKRNTEHTLELLRRLAAVATTPSALNQADSLNLFKDSYLGEDLENAIRYQLTNPNSATRRTLSGALARVYAGVAAINNGITGPGGLLDQSRNLRAQSATRLAAARNRNTWKRALLFWR